MCPSSPWLVVFLNGIVSLFIIIYISIIIIIYTKEWDGRMLQFLRKNKHEKTQINT